MANRSYPANCDFWQKLQDLSNELQRVDEVHDIITADIHMRCEELKPTVSTNNWKREEILSAIENLMLTFIENLVSGKPLKFEIDRRSNSKAVRYSKMKGMEMESMLGKTEVSLTKLQSVRRFVVMAKALSLCYKLIKENNFSTKRELFYLDVNLFASQNCIDEAVTDLACMLRVPRFSLHILASPKGLIIGNLLFQDEEGNLVDCNGAADGVPVPSHVELISQISSDARFILIVEKEATFRKLIDESFTTKMGPCIVITGKGFPDMNTRFFVRKLWTCLKIPILALVDADPHGIEIMCIYRYGSMSLSYDSANLTCTSIRWLGIHPTDIERFSIPDSSLIPMTSRDRNKGLGILKRPYVKDSVDLREQVNKLMTMQTKAEIECLDALSSNFLTDVYLPYKIRGGHWI